MPHIFGRNDGKRKQLQEAQKSNSSYFFFIEGSVVEGMYSLDRFKVDSCILNRSIKIRINYILMNFIKLYSATAPTTNVQSPDRSPNRKNDSDDSSTEKAGKQ